MKGCNKALKKLKYLLVIISIILICNVTHIYATDGEIEDDGTETEDTNLPYIEMKVKSTKGEEGNQVLVEMWGSNFTDLEGIEVVFTYNNEKLIPSNINSNKAIDNLGDIKYVERPTNYNNPQTDFEKAKRDEFNAKSKETLSNSFAFDNNALGIDKFLYLEANGNIEALQFIILREDYSQKIKATEPVLLGKFSFKQTEGTTIDETDFGTMRIKINCNDDSEEGFVQYERSRYVDDKIPSDKCEELIEFTFEKYGSISGTIDIKMENGSKYFPTKNIATIKVYKKQDVESINWLLTGKDYINMKASLPNPIAEYTTVEEENGEFTIDKVYFGEYVVLIDKEYFADFIITNVIVSAENKDVNLSNTEELKSINLIPGDLNKDGKINGTDTTAYKRDLNGSEKLVDFDDASTKGVKNTGTDTRIFNKYLNLYGKVAKTQTIKKVYNWLGGEYEE